MAKISRRSRNRTENKRHGHKAARQETRRVLENGVMPKVARGMHWAPVIEQPPLPDIAATGGPKSKKKGCKRNKYGPHIVITVRPESAYNIVYNPETKRFERRPIPWYQRRYRPPYECMKCHKAFYRVPKGAQRGDAHVIIHNSEQVQMDDHYDQFNIKMRLLGLKCRCLECRDELVA